MRRRGVAPFSLMHLLPSSKDRACPSPQCALVRRVSVGVILVYDMPERNCFFHVRASVIDLGETAQFKRNRSAIEKIGRNMRRGRERHGCRSGGSVRFAAQEDGRGIPEQKAAGNRRPLHSGYKRAIRPPVSAAGRVRRNRGSRRPDGRRSRAPGAGSRRCARRAAVNASPRSVSPTV